MMSLLFEIAGLILVLFATVISLAIFATVLRIGKDRWTEAGQLSGSTKQVFRGEVETDRDGLRDSRVAKGKVWNKATKHWERQGKLSDEYVKNLVG